MNISCVLLLVLVGTCHGFGDLGLGTDEDLQNRLMVCDIKKDRSEEELHQCQKEVRHGKRTLEDLISKMTDIEDKLALTSQQIKELQWAHEDLEDSIRKVGSDNQRVQDKVKRGRFDLEDDIMLAQLQSFAFMIFCGLVQSWVVFRTTRSSLWIDVKEYVAKLMEPISVKLTALQAEVKRLSDDVGLVKRANAQKSNRSFKKPTRASPRRDEVADSTSPPNIRNLRIRESSVTHK